MYCFYGIYYLVNIVYQPTTSLVKDVLFCLFAFYPVWCLLSFLDICFTGTLSYESLFVISRQIVPLCQFCVFLHAYPLHTFCSFLTVHGLYVRFPSIYFLCSFEPGSGHVLEFTALPRLCAVHSSAH